MLGHQLPIGQDFGVQNAAQCVGEDIRVIPVVETPLQFFQVTIKMLDAHVMECSDNRPLEQTPHAFDAVGVDLADNPLLRGVAHGLVYGVVISNPHVGLQLIGVNGLGLILDGSTNEIVEGSLPDIGDALDSDLASLPLDGTGHPRSCLPCFPILLCASFHLPVFRPLRRYRTGWVQQRDRCPWPCGCGGTSAKPSGRWSRWCASVGWPKYPS